MKSNLFFRRMLLLWVLAFSASLWGQVNIIPTRTDVSGFPTWTDNNVAGTTYLQLLKATSYTITPAMDFTSYTGKNLNFKARTFGGTKGDENEITVSISVDNGANYTIIGTRTPINSSMLAQSPFDLSSYSGTQIKIKFSVDGTSDTIGAGIDDIAITGTAAIVPKITSSKSSLTGFSYIEGRGPSADQSFNVGGSNLTNDITVTAPTNFEVSTTSGSGFGSSVNLPQTGGDVYVRMISGLVVGNSYSGNITLSSTGATNVNVVLNGEVTPMPVRPVISAPAAQSGTVGVSYSYQIVASDSPDSYAIAGTLPTGVSLDSTTGIISGTPTTAGSYSTTIMATNAAGTSDAVAFDLTIEKGIQSADLPDLNLDLGGSNVALPATTDEGIEINYSSSNSSVASISGNILSVGTVGSATITAVNTGDLNYNAFDTSFTVNVKAAPCFMENFASITAGNNSNTSGSSTAWAGNSNFPTVSTGYQAGGSVRLGSGSVSGSITSKILPTIGGDVQVKLDVKGWTTVEGDIKVTIGNQSQTVNYTATMADPFETKTLDFTNVSVGSKLKIETTAKRAFIDNVTISCGTATIWAGAWSNGDPDENKDVIIDFDYTGGSFTSKSLTVNANKNLTVPSEGFISTGAVTNNGNILVSNNANFVQTGLFTPGTGSSFKVNRTSKDVSRLDYIAWSSPMEDSPQTLKEFSPQTVDTRFLTYDNGLFVKVVNPNVAFNLGQGYLIRTPNNFSDFPSVQKFNGVFEGTKPNTGLVSYDPSGITGEFVFLGNPYPSAIRMQSFYDANPQIDGSFYIWNSAAAKMDNDGKYSGSNYVTYTSAGSVPEGSAPFVPVAQGFFINRGTSNALLNFNDGMRQTTEKGTFAKASVNDKFWLQMTAPSGTKPQMLIGFNENATSGYDQGLDAKMLDSNADVIYSTVDGKSLIINALGSFSTTDVINVTANFLAAGNYKMSIAKKEGIFSNGQEIYVKDNETGVETELTAGDYSFAATAGLQADRFTLYFNKGVLAASNVTKGQSTIYADHQIVHVKGSSKIASVEVYDLSGKLMKATENVNSDSTSLTVAYKGIAVVKLTLENGEVVTKKIILK